MAFVKGLYKAIGGLYWSQFALRHHVEQPRAKRSVKALELCNKTTYRLPLYRAAG